MLPGAEAMDGASLGLAERLTAGLSLLSSSIMNMSLLPPVGVRFGIKGESCTVAECEVVCFLAFSSRSAWKNMSSGDFSRAKRSGEGWAGGEGEVEDCLLASLSRRAWRPSSGTAEGMDLERNLGMGKEEAAGDWWKAALA